MRDSARSTNVTDPPRNTALPPTATLPSLRAARQQMLLPPWIHPPRPPTPAAASASPASWKIHTQLSIATCLVSTLTFLVANQIPYIHPTTTRIAPSTTSLGLMLPRNPCRHGRLRRRRNRKWRNLKSNLLIPFRVFAYGHGA